MAGKHRRKRRNTKLFRMCLAVCAVVLVMVAGTVGAQILEARMSMKVENAGRQMTDHISGSNSAQIFVDGQWYRLRDAETLLVIGIDDFGMVSDSGSYNNTNQADFMVLFIRYADTGESAAIHLNRDTMTDIPVLGVTGKAAGTQRAQLALAYNYGQGQHDSSRNTVDAVSHLLYGIQIDHYLTVTMNAVPIMNDWAGGVTLEIADDMTGVDSMLAPGETIRLSGEQALAYVRSRMGLDDSTNIHRMERQRQYAAAWVETAQEKLKDQNEVARLVMLMGDHHYSDCTADQLAEIAGALGRNSAVRIHEIPGESVLGDRYMEFHADDAGIQSLMLKLFYQAAE